MSNWKFKVLVLVVLAMILLPLVGTAKTILRVQDWKINETEDTRRWYEEAKRLFEERYPDVEIQYDGIGFGNEYVEKLYITTATDTAPDVAFVSVAWARDLFEAGALLPLNDYVAKSPHVAPDQFIPTTQIYNQKDGIIYGITFALDADFIVYNMNHFDEMGLSTDPYAMATWEDFINFGRKLMVYDANGNPTRYGFDFLPGTTAFSAFLDSNGGSFYNSDFTGLNIDTPQGQEVLQLFYDIRLEYGFASDSYTAACNFLANTASMGMGGIYHSYWAPHYVPGIRLGFTTVPVGPSGDKRGAVVYGNMYSISSASKNPDLAWKFIEFMTSLEAAELHYRITGTVQSPRLDFYQSDLWVSTIHEAQWRQMIPYIGMTTGIWPFVGYDRINQVWGPLISDPLSGKAPLSTNALSEVQRLVNQYLAQ
ncbi:MAG TPA: sugar ABC transporter substrate-binding protein [Firmicutes bacterium]|nr:sugar ABC transporter substrate-binding protein [Bacillota bacterium]